jgi:energy-converting hydrogenase Eha subunit A
LSAAVVLAVPRLVVAQEVGDELDLSTTFPLPHLFLWLSVLAAQHHQTKAIKEANLVLGLSALALFLLSQRQRLPLAVEAVAVVGLPHPLDHK